MSITLIRGRGFYLCWSCCIISNYSDRTMAATPSLPDSVQCCGFIRDYYDCGPNSGTEYPEVHTNPDISPAALVPVPSSAVDFALGGEGGGEREREGGRGIYI